VVELMARLGNTTHAMAMRYQRATADRDQAIAGRLGVHMRLPATPGSPTDRGESVVRIAAD